MQSWKHVVLVAMVLMVASASGVSATESRRLADRSVSAVQKVIQLLGDMLAQAKSMKDAEAVSFSEFTQFCIDEKSHMGNDIAKGKELIETLSADIQKLESDIDELSIKLEELNEGVAKAEADLKEAKAQRDKDHASYTEEVHDYSESVDALERAIVVLQKQNYDRKQASEMLLQLSLNTHFPEQVQRTVATFLELHSGDDFLTAESPEANAYEFQSTAIVDLLKKLRDEFVEKKSTCEKEEMNSKHAYNMIAQDLSDSVEGMTADISDKTVDKQAKVALAADEKKRLLAAQKDLAQDEATLADLNVECSEKTKSFDEKQMLRNEEIEAISKAIEILKSPDVSGAAEEHLPALAQKAAQATSLAQLRSSASHEAPDTNVIVRKFLESEGHRLHSSRLSMLANKLYSDPFAKVKKLIEGLITKLLEESGQESEQKGFCDKELGTNKITRTKLQDTIDGLTASIDEDESKLSEISQRLATLSTELAELRQAIKESTKMRTDEKAKNEDTIDDAKKAKTAVRQALQILKEFYEGAMKATALAQVNEDPMEKIQDSQMGKETVAIGSEDWDALANPNFKGKVDKGHKEGMQTFGKTYRGQQQEAGGVMAFLEVILSDFADLQVDTEQAELESAKYYKDFMTKSEQSIAVKEKESSMLTNDQTETESELVSLKKDLAATQDQLLAADRYYEKLKPTCVDTGVSYEERAKAREEEIQSLKEALRILSGEDIAA